MFCENCGAKVEDGQNYCEACGALLAKSEPAPSPENRETVLSELTENQTNMPDIESAGAFTPEQEQPELITEPITAESEETEPIAAEPEETEPAVMDVYKPEAAAVPSTKQPPTYRIALGRPNVRVLKKKNKAGMLVALALLLVLFIAGVTRLAIPIIKEAFSPEQRLAKVLEQQWKLTDTTDEVLLTFSDGRGSCIQIAQKPGQEDTGIRFTYELVDADTVTITRQGRTQQHKVIFGDDRTMHLAPRLLNISKEIWQPVKRDDSLLQLWDGLLSGDK